jgi:hypothetical protein
MNHPLSSAKHRLVLLAAIALSCLPAAAAPQPAIKAELRFAASGILADHHTLWLRTGPDREPIEVRLNVRTFSEAVRYEGPPAARFYATEAAARATEPAEEPLAAIAVAEGSTLLVLIPATTNYRALPIRGGDFPFQSYRFANLSEALVRVELGQEAANLKPGVSKTFRAPADQAAVGVRLYSKTADNEARLLRQTNWSLPQGQRELILFFIDPANGLVQTRHFIDSRAPQQGGMHATVMNPRA